MWSLGVILLDLACPDYLPLRVIPVVDDVNTPDSRLYQLFCVTNLKIQMTQNQVPHSTGNVILSVCLFAPANC